MNKILTPAQFLEQSQQLVDESVKVSLTQFNIAFTSIINDYENVEFDVNGVEPKEISKAISVMFDNAQPNSYQKSSFDKDGNETITTKKLFKKPSSLSTNLISKMIETQELHEKKLLIKSNQIAIKKKLNKQKPATLNETKKALKAINYATKITNVKESLEVQLDWINNLKNHTSQKKALLYQSQDADGTFRGGNGKSYIVGQILPACEEIGLTSTVANIPDWHTSEITDVFANNFICVAEEQALKVPQNPSNQIIDNNVYSTKVKYEKTMALKSIASFIGTTNQSLINADQTMQRRISLVKCNENFEAEQYIKSHNGVLPNGEEIKKAWVYLLSHDLTNIKVDNNNTKHKQANAISTSELNVLYKLVEAISNVKLINNNNTNVYTLSQIKNEINDDKMFLSAIYNISLKYGAVHHKNGLHGSKPDSHTQIDISNLNIPTEIFDGVEHNPEDVFAAIDELVFIEPTDPTGTDDFDILDDFMSKIQKGEEEKEETKEEVELFDYIEEPKESYSDAFQVYPTNNITDQFETINRCFGLTEIDKVVGITEPHTLARKDDNVFSMRNFCFEIDDLSLQEQIDLIKENKDVINRAVFSGNKSIHCRITINYNPKSKEEYKFIFKYLNEKYFKGVVDTSCSNPSRLTRRPNGVRSDSKKIQKLLFKNNNVIDVEFLHQQFLEEQKVKKVMAKTKPDTRYERKCDYIIEELESLSDEVKETSKWQKAYAIATNDGTAEYPDVWTAISYYKFLGYSSEEIVEQIDFGSWNISVKTIENIYGGE